MAIAYYLVVFLHVVACFFLIAVVLLQQGKGQDLASAFGGGGTQTAFGPRGSANVLSRATTVLAAIFMLSSLALSVVRPTGQTPTERLAAPGAAAPPEAGASPAAAPSGAAPSGSSGAPAASPEAGASTAPPTATTPTTPAPDKKP
jgi:preprotein translocase subunit SecG